MHSIALFAFLTTVVGFSSAHVRTYHHGAPVTHYAVNGHYGHAAPYHAAGGYVLPVKPTYGHHVPVHGVRYGHYGTGYEPAHHGYGYRHHEAPVVVAHPQPTYGTYGHHQPHAYSTVNTVRHDDGYGNGVHAVSHSVSHGAGSHSTVFKKQVHTH